MRKRDSTLVPKELLALHSYVPASSALTSRMLRTPDVVVVVVVVLWGFYEGLVDGFVIVFVGVFCWCFCWCFVGFLLVFLWSYNTIQYKNEYYYSGLNPLRAPRPLEGLWWFVV